MKKLTKAKIRRLERREINKQFKHWSMNVKLRDGNECIICRGKERLNAHHIISKSDKELRFDVNNGISLCPLHHNFSREISPHKNAFVFFIWFMNKRKEQYEYLRKRIK